MERQARIRCPQCDYRPKPEDRWSCASPCQTQWHTFWTGGVCPGCARAWQMTQCPQCNQHSPHRAWYHVPPEEPSEQQHRELEHEPAG